MEVSRPWGSFSGEDGREPRGSRRCIQSGWRRASVTFADAGVFPYFCSYHVGMVGVIAVGEGVALGAGTVGLPSAPTGEPEASTAASASEPRGDGGGLDGVWGAALAVVGLVAAGGGFAALRVRSSSAR